jgi:hypothetical protein
MPKSSPEHYSPELLAHTKNAEGGIRTAIAETHAAYEHTAELHLELLAELKAGETYPFQAELDAIIREEDAVVAPLIGAQHALDARLAKLQAEQKIDEDLSHLEEKILTQMGSHITLMHSSFAETEKRIPVFVHRAEAIYLEVKALLRKSSKTREELMQLPELLGEFEEIKNTIEADQARAMAKNIHKSDDEQ